MNPAALRKTAQDLSTIALAGDRAMVPLPFQGEVLGARPKAEAKNVGLAVKRVFRRNSVKFDNNLNDNQPKMMPFLLFPEPNNVKRGF